MIGKKLKYLLKSTKRKQIDLAKYLGISPSRLSNYLSDKKEPDIDMLGEMAKYLGVDLNYFSNIDFFSKKNDKKISQPTVSVNDVDAPYGSEDTDRVIRVPLTLINAKKRGINTTTVALSAILLKGINEPEKNVTVFEINAYIPSGIAEEYDFLVCVKSSEVPLENGDLLFEHGRNTKFFRYYKTDDLIILVNEDNNKEHTTLTEESALSYYNKLLWVIKKS